MSERDDWYRPPVETTTDDAPGETKPHADGAPTGGSPPAPPPQYDGWDRELWSTDTSFGTPAEGEPEPGRGVPPSARQGHRQASSPRPPHCGLGRHDRRCHCDRARDQGLGREPLSDPVLVHGADAPLRPPGHGLRGALLGPRAREPLHLPLPRSAARRGSSSSRRRPRWSRVQRAGGTFVKRIIGLPGETVRVRLNNGREFVYINGRKLDEPYVQPSRRGFGPERRTRCRRASTSSWATIARRRATRDSGEGCRAGTSSARCSRPTGLPHRISFR